jgi:tryptophan synthase alpha chain
MNPIEAAFESLRQSGRKALIPFLPAGDPDMAFTAEALGVMAAAGASMIEVGVPFSDPIADGPVIQAAYTRALSSGFTLDALFAATGPAAAVPKLAMASFSLIYRRGVSSFLAAARAARYSGLVVPDLPVEESADLAAAAADAGIALTLLVTPTTAPARAERIIAACTGFVYVVSVVGITGTRTNLPTDLAAMIARLRGMTDRPLCVGFGVSTPEQATDVARLADGVIVGSAIVRTLESIADRSAKLTALRTYIASLAAAVNL